MWRDVVTEIRLRATTDATEEIGDSAESVWRTTLDALPRLGVAAIVIAVGWAASRLVRMLVRRALAGRRSPSFSQVMSKIAGWILLFLVVLVAIAVTFPSVRPVDLLAGLGFFSVAVGFAFQDILENTLSGVLLLFRQPFRAGDQIEIEGQVGTVEEITIRETRITTFDGQLVIVPNRDVYKGVIRVQTANRLRRSSFMVGIAYENDPDEALEIAVGAVGAVEGVAADPAPEAIVVELGVSTVDIEVRIWTASHQAERLRVVDAAIRAAKAALDAAGIEMPADIVALQATPSLRAAVHGDGEVTPAGSLRS